MAEDWNPDDPSRRGDIWALHKSVKALFWLVVIVAFVLLFLSQRG